MILSDPTNDTNKGDTMTQAGISEALSRRIEAAALSGEVLKTEERFSIRELPPGENFNHLVLLIWSGAPSSTPSDLMVWPIQLNDGRSAWLLARDAALSFAP